MHENIDYDSTLSTSLTHQHFGLNRKKCRTREEMKLCERIYKDCKILLFLSSDHFACHRSDYTYTYLLIFNGSSTIFSSHNYWGILQSDQNDGVYARTTNFAGKSFRVFRILNPCTNRMSFESYEKCRNIPRSSTLVHNIPITNAHHIIMHDFNDNDGVSYCNMITFSRNSTFFVTRESEESWDNFNITMSE